MKRSDQKREKRTIILAQVFISLMMAFLMTFIFGVAIQGLPPGWPGEWMRHFLMAWPVAFVLSLAVGPVSFRIAYIVMHRAEMRREG